MPKIAPAAIKNNTLYQYGIAKPPKTNITPKTMKIKLFSKRKIRAKTTPIIKQPQKIAIRHETCNGRKKKRFTT